VTQLFLPLLRNLANAATEVLEVDVVAVHVLYVKEFIFVVFSYLPTKIRKNMILTKFYKII